MKLEGEDLSPKLKKVVSDYLMKQTINLQNIIMDEIPVHTGYARNHVNVVDEDTYKKGISLPSYVMKLQTGEPQDEVDWKSLRFWVRKKIDPPDEAVYPITLSIRNKLLSEGADKNPFLSRSINRFKNKFG